MTDLKDPQQYKPSHFSGFYSKRDDAVGLKQLQMCIHYGTAAEDTLTRLLKILHTVSLTTTATFVTT